MQNPAVPAAPDTARDLHRRLAPLMFRDQRRLQRRLDGVRRLRDPQRRDAALAEITAEVTRAEARLEARRAAVPAITYPAQLPVSERKDDIAAAIRDHQVVIVAGETGSGKTTQLPEDLPGAGARGHAA